MPPREPRIDDPVAETLLVRGKSANRQAIEQAALTDVTLASALHRHRAGELSRVEVLEIVALAHAATIDDLSQRLAASLAKECPRPGAHDEADPLTDGCFERAQERWESAR